MSNLFCRHGNFKPPHPAACQDCKQIAELEAELADTVTECLAAKSNEDIMRKQLAELREEMTTRRKHAVKQIEVNDRILLKLAALREAAGEAKDLLGKMQNVQPYSDEIHYVGALLNTELLKERGDEG